MHYLILKGSIDNDLLNSIGCLEGVEELNRISKDKAELKYNEFFDNENLETLIQNSKVRIIERGLVV